MSRKACFEYFYKKISEALIWDDASEDYNYLCNMFLYFDEALTSFKFDLDKSFSSTHTDNLAKDAKIFWLLILQNLYLWKH